LPALGHGNAPETAVLVEDMVAAARSIASELEFRTLLSVPSAVVVAILAQKKDLRHGSLL
jgi:hypothetical protein